MDDKAKKELLEIAREAIKSYFRGQKKIDFNSSNSFLNQKLGVFVTLHINGKLKGCIGQIESNNPLWKTVSEMAVQAAFFDPRFFPLTQDDFKDVQIEISVLTKPQLIKNVKEIILGKHGVIVQKGWQKGVFLPQVALETGWSKEEFMDNLCEGKAGLSRESWKKKEVDIFIFEVEIIKE